jgi:hypothetical protein
VSDFNCISYWFPKLLSVIPQQVPVTHIVRTNATLISLLDGQQPYRWHAFLNELSHWGESVGYPCFLRTGHTSDKHSWDKTCRIESPDQFSPHVCRLVEFSECCSMFGLPYDVWAVRQWLTGPIVGFAPCYGNMPVRREFRFFINNGKIQCEHPYWPTESLLRGGCNEDTMVAVEAMNTIGTDQPELHALVSQVAQAFPGYWSVDCLWTDSGWFVTDMARGENSWHWPECKFSTADL